MKTPFAINHKPTLLRSLEHECAARYSSQSALIEEIIAENKLLRLQRDEARNALSQLLVRAKIGQITEQSLQQAQDALKI